MKAESMTHDTLDKDKFMTSPSSQKIEHLLKKMWIDYIRLNPLAEKIYQTLKNEGEDIINDHIALRTFRHKRVGIDIIARPFLVSGYREQGQYDFLEKKLFAKHYEHEDSSMPKIFISELIVEDFSPSFQSRIEKMIEQIPEGLENSFDFSSIGLPWKTTIADYQMLLEESEYAAWLAAIGFRPNHFTVLVNHLKKFKDLEMLNDFLKEKGFKLNSSGGEIKGSKDVYLEQSSTLANSLDIQFLDGQLKIPTCYYEFAKRYPLENGELYQGFVAKSADKIFESTDKGQ